MAAPDYSPRTAKILSPLSVFLEDTVFSMRFPPWQIKRAEWADGSDFRKFPEFPEIGARSR